ncbi:MAG: methylmalonyl-CoA epimerase [Bacteroidota bacterium]|nr:methylmalonyl-CoA epimerase [Bacteroidota bacterium]
MFTNISHIGIAVKNLTESVDNFKKLFNQDDVHFETVEDQKVNLAFLDVRGVHIELLEPSSLDSPISKFLENRGEGIHHLSFEVDDIEKELSRLKKEGVRLIDETPKVGAGGKLIAFIHPKSTNGVLIELSQKKYFITSPDFDEPLKDFEE